MSLLDKKPNAHRFRPRLEQPRGDDPQGDDQTVTLSHHLTGDSPSFAFLQAIVKDDTQPIGRRMRAAIASIPYEVPKVAVSSGGTNKDFAERLEGTIARSRALRSPDLPAEGDLEPLSDSDNEESDGG